MELGRSNHQFSFYLSFGIFAALIAVAGILVTCSKSSTSQPANGVATINVSVSDPPSCAPPNGPFKSVFITIRSVQANISATADDNSSGWVELVPALNTQPVQVDLLNLANGGACLLKQLGSNTSLPAGDYQQIRLLLVPDNPGSGAVPATNACASLGQVFNCIVDSNNNISELQLSSEANTGLKIPPGQVVGGPIHVAAGQTVDLNVDFNACASVVQEGNGSFRLKPALTAGVVSTNTTGIKGQVIDSVTMQPIAGAKVALENADGSGTDRIFMEAATDSSGQFSFCPLPMGAVFDVVIDAVSSGTAYNATVVLNVPGGTDVGAVPLLAETGAVKGPATIQGTVTAVNGATGASIDAAVSALQTVTVSGSTARPVTTPLLQGSTGNIAVESATPCPASGVPQGAFCAQYTLVVPASNPMVGTFSAGKIAFSQPAGGDVAYSVSAIAAKPLSGGAPICSPSSLTTSQDTSSMPLKVMAGVTTTAKEIDFAGCS